MIKLTGRDEYSGSEVFIPEPQLLNSQRIGVGLSYRQSMTGELYTYVKKRTSTQYYRFSHVYLMDYMQVLMLINFLDEINYTKIYLTYSTELNELQSGVWECDILTNPINPVSRKRASRMYREADETAHGSCNEVGEQYQVVIEYQGYPKISGLPAILA